MSEENLKNQSKSTEQHELKKNSPFWFKTLLGVIALLLGALILNAYLTEDLTDTVEEQLTAIREGDLSKAYYDFSSNKFQEATSLEAFNDFINKYPAFSQNKKIYFKERNVNNDIGWLDCVLETKDNKKIFVEYKLVKENEKWKISSIRLEDKLGDKAVASAASKSAEPTPMIKSPQTPLNSHLKFDKFIVGNALNAQGLVNNPKSTFNSNSGDIYLNLHITEANSGTPLKVILNHIDSNSSLNPVNTQVTEDGETTISFVFSPPNNHWPVGNYRIDAIAEKAAGSVYFIIEE